MSYIFVYGTLKKASRQLNEFTLTFHEGAEWMEDASLKGSLYAIDWYPAFKTTGDTMVQGEIYRILSPTLLAELDAYEDAISEETYLLLNNKHELIHAEYVRRKRMINNIECWFYEYVKEVKEASSIKNGSFE